MKKLAALMLICGLLVSCSAKDPAADETTTAEDSTAQVTEESTGESTDPESDGGQSTAADGIHHEVYYAVELSFIDHFIGTDEFYNDFVPKFGKTRDKTYRGVCEYYGISKEEYTDFWDGMREAWKKNNYLSENYPFEKLYPLEDKYDAWFSDDYETNEAFIHEGELTSAAKKELEKAASSYISDKRDDSYTLRYYTIDYKLIDQSAAEIVDTAKRTGAIVKGPVPLPTRMKRFDILRSPHVNKTSRDQFEIRTHQRLMDIVDPTDKTVDALMKLDLPAGVDVEIKLQ